MIPSINHSGMMLADCELCILEDKAVRAAVDHRCLPTREVCTVDINYTADNLIGPMGILETGPCVRDRLSSAMSGNAGRQVPYPSTSSDWQDLRMVLVVSTSSNRGDGEGKSHEPSHLLKATQYIRQQKNVEICCSTCVEATSYGGK